MFRSARIHSARRKGSTLVVDLLLVVLMGAVSLGVGVAANRWRAEPVRWTYQSPGELLRAAASEPPAASVADSPPPETPREIRLDDFQKFVMESRGLVLDARAATFFDEAHVPGALNLTPDDFAAGCARLRGPLEAHREGEIAVYCSGPDCPDAQRVAEALAKAGYRRLWIYTAGWDEWSRTGLPQESAKPVQ